MMDWSRLDLRVDGLLQHYRQNDFTPAELIQQLQNKADLYGEHNIWIHRLNAEELRPYLASLSGRSIDSLPLYGVPFAVKDNIDIAGIPTTAGCAGFAYLPEHNAAAVQLLIDAGAIPIGKANMDQFATGLVGTRSPYGICRNAFNLDYIAGGSSSGSAVAVALGLASFSLGTDTAGSGRVPAALNNLIGLKPTKGLISTRGVVPACRSLDCVSIFALTAEDATTIFDICAAYDQQDCFARRNCFSNTGRQSGIGAGEIRIGVPEDSRLEFFNAVECRRLFDRAVQQWRELGACIETIDFTPFLEAAKLLYAGPWLAERYIVIEDLLQRNPHAIHPVVRGIVETGREFTAAQAFRAQYRLQALKKAADAELAKVDFILTPTVAAQFTVEQVLTEPVLKNNQLGYYTNFMNLLDYSAIAVPAGQTVRGVPWGVTLFAPGWHDQMLLAWAAAWQRATQQRLGALDLPPYTHALPRYTAANYVDLVVCGAHLQGQPLNWQLRLRRGELKQQTRTSARYRLYALADGKRPALVRDEVAGAAIDVEVWRLPAGEFGGFVAAIPAPLGIGKVELEDLHWYCGFISEPVALTDATDITHLGGWRQYLAQAG